MKHALYSGSKNLYGDMTVKVLLVFTETPINISNCKASL